MGNQISKKAIHSFKKIDSVKYRVKIMSDVSYILQYILPHKAATLT